MVTHYHWEIQHYDADRGVWRHRLGEDERGADRSGLHPNDFAYTVLKRLDMLTDSGRRCVVWDVPGVGKLPVATLAGCSS